MKINHHALLMLEYGAAFVPLDDVAEKYLGMSPDVAARHAGALKLPFPVMRCGTQKSAYMVSIMDLADFLNAKHAEAAKLWSQMNGQRSATAAARQPDADACSASASSTTHEA